MRPHMPILSHGVEWTIITMNCRQILIVDKYKDGISNYELHNIDWQYNFTLTLSWLRSHEVIFYFWKNELDPCYDHSRLCLMCLRYFYCRYATTTAEGTKVSQIKKKPSLQPPSEVHWRCQGGTDASTIHDFSKHWQEGWRSRFRIHYCLHKPDINSTWRDAMYCKVTIIYQWSPRV